jgi:hypothetical protein
MIGSFGQVGRSHLYASTLAVAVALAGCGGSASSPAPAPVEHSDRPAPLAAGWRRVTNAKAGFTVGIPPGWTARYVNGTTLVRSHDGGLAVAIGADRSDAGRAMPLVLYARRALLALSGYRALRVTKTSSVDQLRYLAVSASGTGIYTRTSVSQAILLFALRRPGAVTYTLAFLRGSRIPLARYVPEIDAIVKSFRAQAPIF